MNGEENEDRKLAVSPGQNFFTTNLVGNSDLHSHTNTASTMIIDLRSDTFTKPTPRMMEYVMDAEVGDDVFEEDPTVNRLEAMTSVLFGMEAALYCPSGTMSNQIAIKVHTVPGDEVICDKTAHVFQYEGGGIAFNSGAQVRLLEGDRGRINHTQVEASINNPDDVHKARTSLVCLENTSNRGGGSCYDLGEIAKIKKVCVDNNLKLHLDGARLFNALIATGDSPAAYGKLFDSVSVCFNKGLGCPIGSILVGSKEFIRKARRIRKVLGGGLRQAGYMAATAIYALQNNIERLEDDHNNAKAMAKCLAAKSFIGEILPVETNIVIFEIREKYTAAEFAAELKKKDILALPISKTHMRMVFHLGVSNDLAQNAIKSVHMI